MIAFRKAALSLAAVAAIAFGPVEAVAQSSDGEDRRVLIENRSGQTIIYVHGSPTSHSDFGPDRIPDRVISNGQQTVVDFDSGTRHCMFDLRATLADGRNVDRFNVNVCRISHWRISRTQNTVR